jgi:hypothetical protein
VRAVQEAAAVELGAALSSAARGRDPRADLIAMADAFRAFAHRRSGAYGLLFAALPDEMRASPETNQATVAPVLTALAALVPGGGHGGMTGRTDEPLEAARLFVAFAHGFVSMELAGAFRLGGDVDRAWRTGVRTIVDAVAARPG